MADHKLTPGRNLISAVVALGEALGYHVVREHPVERDRTNPPAVDVAWFAEPHQAYPLMIFEVESRATSSIANNATKVFGQPSTRFEKPLFFFHLVLRAADTSRLETLGYTYGSHNYRNFNLSQISLVDVFEAVLAQHRRIRSSVSLGPLRECLDHDGWEGVRPQDLVRIVTQLGFVADFEPSMCAAALRGPADVAALGDWLVDYDGLSGANQDPEAMYPTYLGYDTAHPLHLGFAAALRPQLAADLADRFRTWEGSDGDGLSRLGPHWGLNRDWDDFLIGGAPALCATVGALMPSLAAELLEHLAELRSKLVNLYGVPNAIWALHLASFTDDQAAFDAARTYINDREGANQAMVLLPDPFYATSGDETWPDELVDNPLTVPDMPMFRDLVQSALPGGTEPSALIAALRLLVDDRYSWTAPYELIAALAR